MTKKPILLFKYGGNAMINQALKTEVLKNILSLKEKGMNVVIVHGGGPFIKQALEDANIKSEFVDGHRVTTKKAFEYVEMALNGKVNGDLVSTINSLGYEAVGLSGKDGKITTAKKRQHKKIENGKETTVDIGQVGDLKKINTNLLDLLLIHNYVPVISCISADENGLGYNINGDIFAGSLAGALNAEQFIVLTDVDGLLKDKDDSNSIIRKINLQEVHSLTEKGIIQGGMIPKMEACETAIKQGAASSKIINGTKPEQILNVDSKLVGTLITK